MTTFNVTNQAEMAAAVAKAGPRDVISINSPAGVWLRLGNNNASSVEARESSSVVAWGSSRVEARGSSRVVAWGSSRVVAWGSSRVEARESSRVVAWESSSVEARESSRVEARGSSRVVAAPYVAVHLHSGTAKVKGGVVIDVTGVNDTGQTWADYHGLPVKRGKVTLYKAVGDDWATGAAYAYQPAYKPGARLAAPDWRDEDDCGGGLHFGPTPRHAQAYHGAATRFVAVSVDIATLRPISGSTAKAKAPKCRVLHEVDIDGNEVTP